MSYYSAKLHHICKSKVLVQFTENDKYSLSINVDFHCSNAFLIKSCTSIVKIVMKMVQMTNTDVKSLGYADD